MTSPEQQQLDQLLAQGVLTQQEYDAAVARLAVGPATYEPAAATPAEPPAVKNRRTALIVGIAVAAVLVIAAAIVVPLLVFGGDNSKTTASSSSAPTDTAIPTDEPPSDDPTTPDEPEEPTNYALGEALSITSTDDDTNAQSSADVTVTSVRTATYDSSTDETPTRGLYVIVKLSVTGTDGAVTFNPDDFYVSTAAGDHYEDETFSDAFGSVFDAITIHSGEKSSGTIVFDAGKSAKTGSIYYSPNRDGNPIGYWTYPK